MGIQITRNRNRLLFDCYVPKDLSNSVLFSTGVGNLTSISLSLTDPTCTEALVAGGGTPFIGVESTSPFNQWTLVEQLVDQSGQTDTTRLTQAGQAALLAGQAGPLLQMTATDTPQMTFGRDYWLGDIVSVEAVEDDNYSDIVTSVTMSVDGSQTPAITVIPQVGYTSDPGTADPGYVSQLLKRVKQLERKLNIRTG